MAVLSYNEGGSGDFVVVDEGVYPATITDVQETTSNIYTTKDGAGKPQLQVDFTIAAADCDQDEDVRIRQWYGLSFTSKSKLTAVIQAVLGVTPGPGVEVDTDDLFEKRCQVMVDQFTNKDGVLKNGVVKVLAPKKRKQQAPPPEDEDDEPAPAQRELVTAARKSAPF